jgi:hypothetical protein
MAGEIQLTVFSFALIQNREKLQKLRELVNHLVGAPSKDLFTDLARVAFNNQCACVDMVMSVLLEGNNVL